MAVGDLENRTGRSSSTGSNISALTDDEHRCTSGSLAEVEDEDASNDGSVDRQSRAMEKKQAQSAIRKRAISEAAARDARAALEAESPVAAHHGNGREPTASQKIALDSWEKKVDGEADEGDGGRSGGSGSPMDDGDNENDTNVSAEEREKRKLERLKRHRERKQVRPLSAAAVAQLSVRHTRSPHHQPSPPCACNLYKCTNAQMHKCPRL
mmetsp:Transcript_43662/g.118738  ORF Transcript_43662/g.118738 Transcript_43662/m.118738 type:complete len:211 (-) Transcript_43662:3267-3899(-)